MPKKKTKAKAKTKSKKKSATKKTKKASGSERRRLKRWNVAVLVKCSVPQPQSETFEVEMWARDVNSTGLKLEWTHGLTATKVMSEDSQSEHADVRFEDITFSKGARIMVQDLFYDDDGSPYMEGKILWARKSAASGNWGVGVGFTKNDKQAKAHLGAFKDFLDIVKNPTAAIARASK